MRLRFLFLVLPALSSGKPSCLPVVDLGYERHQALTYNATTDVYFFSNIRYAQPPIGDLRFRAPVPPVVNRTTIRNGSEPSRTCPQGVPSWESRFFVPSAKYTAGAPFSLTAWETDVEQASPISADWNAASTEDCLFLDVYTPGKVLQGSHDNVPVLVCIHGGGMTQGSKSNNGSYNPSGLLEHARKINNKGMVFVAFNYRLGALGFLAGNEVKNDGVLNAGLLDQRFALQWVQQNIHLFGGSPRHVTVMGESAGGGSVLLHLIGDRGSAPFSQLIAQSPAMTPTMAESESAFSDFLAGLNATSLAEIRKLDSETVIRANALQIQEAPATSFVFGPVPDGALVPGPFLNTTNFDQAVRVMVSHNSFEAAIFYDPDLKSEDDFRKWVGTVFYTLSPSAVQYLTTQLYPPQFDGSLGYVDQATRQMAFWGEAVIECNFLLANDAFKGRSYAYQFSVSPGFHLQDLTFTFNKGPALSPQAQDIIQQSIATFVLTGEPSYSVDGRVMTFPQWGSGQALMNITATGAEISKSAVNQTRCAWWKAGNF